MSLGEGGHKGSPVDPVALKSRIGEMYPVLKGSGFSLKVEWKEEFDSYLISAFKGKVRRCLLLNREDAIACLQGEVCVYLGVWFLHVLSHNSKLEAKSPDVC